MNRVKGKSMRNLKGYFPTMEEFWEGMKKVQRAAELMSIMAVMLLSSILMTQTFIEETWDFQNQSIPDIIVKYTPLVVVCVLLSFNVYISNCGSEELKEYLHNCFGKICFEIVLIGMIYALTRNTYYAMLYGVYGIYAAFIFIRYNYPVRKEEVTIDTEDEKKAMKDVYDRIKSRFPTNPPGSSIAKNRKIKRVRRN